ncbi:MAG: hypothetical protein ACYTGG_04060 [Planctomycetota bacterium]|jgi:hypothetical protein
MLSWVMVGVQSALALVALHGLWRHVLPVTATLRQPGIVLDVWGPLALVMPLLFTGSLVDGAVSGPGWTAVGGPVVAAALGGGVAACLTTGAGVPGSAAGLVRCGLACAGAGVLLVLLGAAHELTTSVGQAAFAAAAVLLWINTPAVDAVAARTAPTAEQARAGGWMVVVVGCSIGQGVTSLWVDPGWTPVSTGLMVGYAAAAIALAGWRGGPSAWRRLAGWSAALGVLLSLGIVSLIQLLPRVRDAIASGGLESADALRRIAYGFGHLAPEAVLLIVLGTIVATGEDRRIPARRWIGGLVFVAGGWLLVRRLIETGAAAG